MCGVQAPGGGEQSRENVAVVRGGLPARVVTLEVQPGGGLPGLACALVVEQSRVTRTLMNAGGVC